MKTKKKKHKSSKSKGEEDIHNLAGKDEKYPGYPLYPESEDIMNHQNSVTKIPMDDVTLEPNEIPKVKKPDSEPAKAGILSKKNGAESADVTKEDPEELGSDELNNDGGADYDLKGRTHPVDMSAGDLDIPGSELDDKDEAIGEEDEENNSYSIGGDRHEDLEENTGKD